MNASLLTELAALARYPSDEYSAHVNAAREIAPRSEPLRAFSAAIARTSIARLQELYTRTFDLNPVCSPELGWHLFGESYERGAFLVRIKAELRRHGIDTGSELPDHFSCALELASRMSTEDAEFFVVACLAPALYKMLESISADSIFRHLLLAAREAMEQEFPAAREVAVPEKLTVLNQGAIV